MKTQSLLFFLLIGLFMSPTGILVSSNSFEIDSKENNRKAQARAINWLHNSKNQIGFLENKGQIMNEIGDKANHVRFVLERGDTRVFLLDNTIAWQFQRMHYPEGFEKWNDREVRSAEDLQHYQEMCNRVRFETFRMDVSLVGANSELDISFDGKSDDYLNYYQYDALNVHHYQKVIYHNVYPNIDWVVYTSQEGIKYDFIVKPGGDPASIKLQMSHQDEVLIDERGRLIQKSVMGDIIESAPMSFQNTNEIYTRFVLDEDILSFEVGVYDSNQILIIDPERIWGTYYGGYGLERGYSCVVDQNNNVYLAGYAETSTPSTIIASGGHQNIMGGSGFIVTSGDAFLVKFNPDGQRIWGTFYGGAGWDEGLDCTTDAIGNVYMAGKTDSPTNIAWNGHLNTNIGEPYYMKSFLVKFNSAGVRQWATYYGGPDDSHGQSCCTDQNGNVYLAGHTYSSTLVASQGHQNTYSGSRDSYLVKFNSNGVRQWATYYGGSGNETQKVDCVVDQQNNVYLIGGTSSNESIAYLGYQNVLNGTSDGYIAKFNSNGNRIWATYCGGNGSDGLTSGAIDNNNYLIVVGTTRSEQGVFLNGFQNELNGTRDAFVTKLNPSGNRIWSTYFGGNLEERSSAVATDSNNNIYLSGGTTSISGLAFNGVQNTQGGGFVWDGYLAKFNSNGLGLWATYIGQDALDEGFACATDDGSHVYVAGTTESATGIAEDGHQNSYGGGWGDAFLIKYNGDITSNISQFEDSENVLFLFPNPVISHANLHVLNELIGDEYVIFDVLGEQVQTGLIESSNTRIELNSLSSGAYILKVAKGSNSIKFVKQ